MNFLTHKEILDIAKYSQTYISQSKNETHSLLTFKDVDLCVIVAYLSQDDFSEKFKETLENIVKYDSEWFILRRNGLLFRDMGNKFSSKFSAEKVTDIVISFIEDKKDNDDVFLLSKNGGVFYLVPTLLRGNAYSAYKMGRSRYKIVDPKQPHFVTCTVLHWIPVFTRPDTVEILLASLRKLMAEGLKVYAYVILENHLHLVAQSNDLERDMARFKSYTGKQLIQYLVEHNVKAILEQLAFYKKAHKQGRGYQFWQEGIHPEWIQNDEMMRQKVDYIHNNPVKRGYVDLPEHWRYSSARNYLSEVGLLDVCRLW